MIKKIIVTITFICTTLSGPAYAIYDHFKEHNEVYAFMNEEIADHKLDRILYLEKRYCGGEECKNQNQMPDLKTWKEYLQKVRELNAYWENKKS